MKHARRMRQALHRILDQAVWLLEPGHTERPVGWGRPFTLNGRRYGWRVWVGPLVVSRVYSTRFAWWDADKQGWPGQKRSVALTVAGLSLSADLPRLRKPAKAAGSAA